MVRCRMVVALVGVALHFALKIPAVKTAWDLHVEGKDLS